MHGHAWREVFTLSQQAEFDHIPSTNRTIRSAIKARGMEYTGMNLHRWTQALRAGIGCRTGLVGDADANVKVL